MPNKNHQPSLEDAAADQVDAQIRECLSSLPAPVSAGDFEKRVLAKLRRRRMAVGATAAASLLVLLSATWAFFAGGGNPQQPKVAGNNQAAGDAKQPANAAADEVELFASAYQGLPSPVADLGALENESEALLNYLGSLETKEEQK